MASIHRDPRGKSPYWYCAFTLPDGRRTFRSTKLTDRKQALDVCLQWECASEQGRGGCFVEAQARRVLNTILENTGQAPLETETIRQFFKSWLDGKELAKKPSTAIRYRAVLDRFLTSLGPRADYPLGSLTPRSIEAFRNTAMDDGKAPKTVSIEVKILRTVLNVARRQGRIQTNPAEAVELPKLVSHRRDVFTPEQIQTLLNVADMEWQTAILCGFFLGARLTDVTHLTWENVDLVRRVITYEQRKTGKTVMSPIHPELEAQLSKLAGDDAKAALCPGLRSRSVGGRSGLSMSFTALMRKAGVDQQLVAGKGGKEGRQFSKLSFHSLRHTFTSALANAGIPGEVRQLLTGHSDSATHQKYTHLELEPLRAAIAVLPRITPK